MKDLAIAPHLTQHSASLPQWRINTAPVSRVSLAKTPLEKSASSSSVQARTSTMARRDARRAKPLHASFFAQNDKQARVEVERYISQQFLAQYEAKINHFLPCLLSLKDLASNNYLATVGMQAAMDSSQSLFVEQYLDVPIEDAINTCFDVNTSRQAIVEIGNLVATERGGSYLLFTLMTRILSDMGFTWLVFTATAKVERIIHKMGFFPRVLCVADRGRLANPEHWGSYYDANPRVMVGYLPDARKILKESEMLATMLAPLEADIQHILTQFRASLSVSPRT